MNQVVLGTLVVLMVMWTDQASGDCPKDFCNLADCFNIPKANCTGVFIRKGGRCGCCDACYEAIEPGQKCQYLDLNNPPSAVCKNGFFCGFGICRPLLG